MSEQDQEQKTEQPTQKRLEEALKKGQTYSSREVNHFFMLLAFTFVVVWLAPGMLRDTRDMLAIFIASPDAFPLGTAKLGHILTTVIFKMGAILAVPLLVTVLAALVASFIQKRFAFSWDPVMPKFEKISPAKGLKRLFSRRTLVEFIKSVIKLIIVGFAAFWAVWPKLVDFKQLPTSDVGDILLFLGALTARMMIAVCAVMFLIAIADYLYQYFEYMRSLRMTKQEVRDEYKQQEGDPVVKQRLRSLRRERARRRMMAAVPTADVVITNPTHYAVALAYEQGTMSAPRVVAKGADRVAFRIREVAKENDVPIVENPPLARTLHDTVELDREIPLEHYKAVAEVIGYVYRLKGKSAKRK